MAYNEYAGRGVEIGKVHVLQGETYEKTKMAEDVRKQWLKEIDVFEEIGREDFVAIALDELGKTQLNGSEWSHAERTFEKLLRILKDKYPHYKASIANAKRSLGNACWELGERDEDEGKRDKAIGLYEEALEAYESLENEATEGFDKRRELQKIEKRLAEMRSARTSANKKKATSNFSSFMIQ